MFKTLFVAYASVACAACQGDRPLPTAAKPTALAKAAPPVLDPHLPLRVEPLGSPVRAARTWTTALVPNNRGGWNFITQSWELGSHELPEYVVVDLEAGTYTVTDAPRIGYAGSKYQAQNQLRAHNGRVFFPLSDVGLAYYDPIDESIKDVPPLLPPSGPDKIIYSATFGPDGLLYGGTQSNALPTIVQIDPVTLKTHVVGHVGRDRKTYSYAYQIVVAPPWIYAAVGQMPWELAALNIKTGESRILATRTEQPWMELQVRPEGVRAMLISGFRTPQVVRDYVWCVNGTATTEAPKPIKGRKVIPSKPLPAAPELDVSRINPDRDGIGRIGWRAAGSSPWKVIEYRVKHTMPIAIEALTALPGGGVLGGTKQYHGLFRTQEASSVFLGGPSPSQTKFALLDGTIYLTGYPNGVLYAYAPRQPWTSTSRETAAAPGANPSLLGTFTQAGAKYAYFLTPSRNRLYFAGRRERDGVGTGVGYYEPETKTFAGHHDNLSEFIPSGLAVLPALQTVVLSVRAEKHAKIKQAELIVFDSELREKERLVVKPDLVDTGLIVPSPVNEVVIGVLPNALYRYDIAARKLLEWRELTGKVSAVAPPSGDGSLWCVIDRSLVRIDLSTLETVSFGKPNSLPAGIEHLAWDGDDIYASAGAELFRVVRVGLH